MTLTYRCSIKIVETMERQTHKKDADIIKEGDEGTQMFVLEKGAVQVTKVKYRFMLGEVMTFY